MRSGATRLMGTTALMGAVERDPRDSLTRILRFFVAGGAIDFFMVPADGRIFSGESFAGTAAFEKDLRRVMPVVFGG